MQIRTLAFVSLAAFAGSGLAQQTRIAQKIDNTQRVTLTGQVHPKALPEFDQGRVSPSLAISYVTIELAKSPSQQTGLD
ncbi:MAG TPA: hypothetical protein VKG25_00960, partial [Bryobacteraceae bacterium]|nr:hypothetical protein [Bryobacteraceae bacterium]